MITREQAVNSWIGQIFYHRECRNADGTPMQAKVNGGCKTWKTRNDWRLPMKHGLRDYFYIGNDMSGITVFNNRNWYTVEWEWLWEGSPFRMGDGTPVGVVADWWAERGVESKAVELRALGRD